MVSDMHALFYVGLPRRISSVVASGLCVFCSFSQPAVCLSIDGVEPKKFVNEFIDHISEADSERLIKKFDELENAINSSENPCKESREFLQLFIEETNARYGSSLTIHDTCRIVRENFHILQLPVEAQRLILETIALFEIAPHPSSEQIQHFEKVATSDVASLSIIGPWGGKWFGRNEKKHKKPKQSPPPGFIAAPSLHTAGTSFETSKTDKELPCSVYVGGTEALAGALVFVLGRVCPPAYGIGASLMMDGVRRVLDGLENMDQQDLPGPNQPFEAFDDNFQE